MHLPGYLVKLCMLSARVSLQKDGTREYGNSGVAQLGLGNDFSAKLIIQDLFYFGGDTQCWRSCCVHTNDLRTALPRLRSTCWWSILPHSPTWQIRAFQSYYSPEAFSPLRHCPPGVNSRTGSTQGIDAFGTQQNRFTMVSIFSWSCWWCCCKVHQPCVCGHFYLASYKLDYIQSFWTGDAPWHDLRFCEMFLRGAQTNGW